MTHETRKYVAACLVAAGALAAVPAHSQGQGAGGGQAGTQQQAGDRGGDKSNWGWLGLLGLVGLVGLRRRDDHTRRGV